MRIVKKLFLVLLMLGSGADYTMADVELELEGISDEKLREYIVSKIEENEESSDIVVRRDIIKALQARGYYDAKLIKLEAVDENKFAVSVLPGEQYHIKDVLITHGSTHSVAEIESLPGQVLDARKVLVAEEALSSAIREGHCFYNLKVGHEVVLSEETRTGSIRIEVQTGEEATFGETTFSGAPNVDEEYLKRFVTFQPGDCWRAEEIEATKTALLQTGLFSLIQESLPSTPPANGIVPVRLNLKEREPRKVRLGVSYFTDEGPGVITEWFHNNLFGSAQDLSFRLSFNGLRQNATVDYKEPFFLSDVQTLALTASLDTEDNESYEEKAFRLQGVVTRTITDNLDVKYGAGYELLEIKEDNMTDRFGLFYLPLGALYDGRDDPLDPHSGILLNASFTPFFDTLGEASPFTKSRLDGSTYLSFPELTYDPVLAFRAAVGSIQGADTGDIPASRRFFAGGGGSIRGVGYQEAGPIVDGDPLGGRSLFELSTELRLKFTDTYGAAAFVDAGRVFETQYPDFRESLFIGAGLGFRYYTSFGPLRFDVGVPVNNRRNQDDDFQIYFSIGQAY